MKYTPSPALSDAATYLSAAPSLVKVPNTTKLELYGLYKYLTTAPLPQGPRPFLFDMTGRAKWDAWSNIGKMYAGQQPDAEKRYLDIARELGWVSGAAAEDTTQKEIPLGDVWDDDLGVRVSRSSSGGRGGMGTSVSAMVPPGDDDAEAQTLYALAIRGDVNKVIQFLERNPLLNINQRDEFGYTALHLACDRGSLPVVEVLIKNGADPLMKDSDDLTVTELAQIAGHSEICTFLQKGYCNSMTVMQKA
ncbi:ankyrin [Gyrodon lividus]|nr:ankyrin [Gyrodon lividus]